MCPLSPRQFAVLGLLAEGLAPKQIAARLGVSQSTVRGHVHLACRALGADTGWQAVAIFARHDWAPPPRLSDELRSYADGVTKLMRGDPAGREQMRRVFPHRRPPRPTSSFGELVREVFEERMGD